MEHSEEGEIIKRKKLPPIHRGEIILDEFMEPRGLNQHQLAAALGVNVSRINRIIGGKSCISADTAMRLTRYFGTTPQLWMNLQARYGLERAKDEREAEINRTVQPRTKTDPCVVPA